MLLLYATATAAGDPYEIVIRLSDLPSLLKEIAALHVVH